MSHVPGERLCVCAERGHTFFSSNKGPEISITGQASTNTDGRARFKVKDVGKINFFIYYEVDEDTSKHSLQSSTYGRDQESKQESGCSLHPLRVNSECAVAGF